jgi:hypothetical protein
LHGMRTSSGSSRGIDGHNEGWKLSWGLAVAHQM